MSKATLRQNLEEKFAGHPADTEVSGFGWAIIFGILVLLIIAIWAFS